MYEGVKGAIDVYKSNRNADVGFWKSLGKASAVGGTGLAAAGLSFAPGMGLVAPIAGSAAIGAMTNKLSVEVSVDGEKKIQHELAVDNQAQGRSAYADEMGAADIAATPRRSPGGE